MSVSPPTASAPKWDVLVEADDHRAYAWDRLLVVVFDGPTSIAGARAIQQTHREMIGRGTIARPSLSSITLLVGELTLQVDPQVRAIATEIAKEAAAVAVAGAVVVPASGWMATVFRSIITGVHLIARVNTPNRVFSELHEAVRWVAAQPGQVPTIAEHVEAIHAACERSGVAKSRSAAAPDRIDDR